MGSIVDLDLKAVDGVPGAHASDEIDIPSPRTARRGPSFAAP
jgi:hypothetical protein